VWLVLLRVCVADADADTDAEAAAASVCRSPSRRRRAILAQVLTFGSGKSRSRLAQVQNGPLDRFVLNVFRNGWSAFRTKHIVTKAKPGSATMQVSQYPEISDKRKV